MKIISSLVKKKLQRQKIVHLSMTIYAQQAKVGSEISLILGQYGISVSKFCNEFNEKTECFSPELPLIVNMRIYVDNRTFKFFIRGFNLVKFFKKFVDTKMLDSNDFFSMAYLCLVLISEFYFFIYFPAYFLYFICKLLFSLLNSFNISYKLDFNLNSEF